MLYTEITPVHKFGDFYVKREDLAHWHSLDHPSGSKVRQYMKMCTVGELYKNPLYINSEPLLVGCSADSCMAVYVASTANLIDTKGIIYTAKRKVRSDAINYAMEMGAEVVEITPAHLSVIKARARERAKELGKVVQWDRKLAIEDTVAQCVNIPEGVKRIIVPTGSGLTATGVIIGLAKLKFSNQLTVVVQSTSTMCTPSTLKNLLPMTTVSTVKIEFRAPNSPYQQWALEKLPDGTPLDPFYAAKAPRLLTGDLLWPPGLRPVRAMPKACRDYFKAWKGPQNDQTK